MLSNSNNSWAEEGGWIFGVILAQCGLKYNNSTVGFNTGLFHVLNQNCLDRSFCGN